MFRGSLSIATAPSRRCFAAASASSSSRRSNNTLFSFEASSRHFASTQAVQRAVAKKNPFAVVDEPDEQQPTTVLAQQPLKTVKTNPFEIFQKVTDSDSDAMAASSSSSSSVSGLVFSAASALLNTQAAEQQVTSGSPFAIFQNLTTTAEKTAEQPALVIPAAVPAAAAKPKKEKKTVAVTSSSQASSQSSSPPADQKAKGIESYLDAVANANLSKLERTQALRDALITLLSTCNDPRQVRVAPETLLEYLDKCLDFTFRKRIFDPKNIVSQKSLQAATAATGTATAQSELISTLMKNDIFVKIFASLPIQRLTTAAQMEEYGRLLTSYLVHCGNMKFFAPEVLVSAIKGAIFLKHPSLTTDLDIYVRYNWYVSCLSTYSGSTRNLFRFPGQHLQYLHLKTINNTFVRVNNFRKNLLGLMKDRANINWQQQALDALYLVCRNQDIIPLRLCCQAKAIEATQQLLLNATNKQQQQQLLGANESIVNNLLQFDVFILMIARIKFETKDESTRKKCHDAFECFVSTCVEQNLFREVDIRAALASTEKWIETKNSSSILTQMAMVDGEEESSPMPVTRRSPQSPLEELVFFFGLESIPEKHLIVALKLQADVLLSKYGYDYQESLLLGDRIYQYLVLDEVRRVQEYSFPSNVASTALSKCEHITHLQTIIGYMDAKFGTKTLLIKGASVRNKQFKLLLCLAHDYGGMGRARAVVQDLIKWKLEQDAMQSQQEQPAQVKQEEQDSVVRDAGQDEEPLPADATSEQDNGDTQS